MVASYARRVPIGFSDYILEKVRAGDVPPFDEVMKEFPDLEFTEEEEAAAEAAPEAEENTVEDAVLTNETPEVPETESQENLLPGTPETPALTYDAGNRLA